jgi:undecaprenyl-phosphate 4-deoxy-4-formamido-L-arabinose transferase
MVSRLEPVLGSCCGEHEIILVNDGSRDASWDVIAGLADTRACVRGVNLMRNYGQHNALLCGIRLARHEVIVTMDDDLQHPPEEIPKLLEKIGEGHDVVYGTPLQEQHGFFRDMASLVTKSALKATIGAENAQMASAFRAFRTPLREAFADYRGSFVSLEVLLTWGTTRFASVKVRHDERKAGVSNYTLWKLVTHAFNMMTGFSSVPLQLASILGFIFTIFGLGLLGYVVGNYFVHGGGVPGFSFLACTIVIFSGVQLVLLGIFGEYLARIHFRTMDRPSSVIREVRGSKDLSDGRKGG